MARIHLRRGLQLNSASRSLDSFGIVASPRVFVDDNEFPHLVTLVTTGWPHGDGTQCPMTKSTVARTMS